MFIADLQDSLERRAADLLLSSIEQRNHISSPLIGCGSGFLCNERVRRTGPGSSSRRWNRNRRSKSREASEKPPHPCSEQNREGRPTKSVPAERAAATRPAILAARTRSLAGDGFRQNESEL